MGDLVKIANSNQAIAKFNFSFGFPVDSLVLLKLFIMKKLVFLLVCCISSVVTIKAQSTRFGLTGGLLFANYHAKVDGESTSGDSKGGIAAGLLVDVPLSKNLSFQPALNFTQKGTAERDIFFGITETSSLRINCIEIPLNILYNTSGNNGNFFIGAGPSVAFNVSGKWKFKDGGDSYARDVEFGNTDEDDFKSLDLGANFLTGYAFPNGLMLAVNYNLGLSNLFTDENDNSTFKSSYLALKLGFLFNTMKNKK